MKATGFALLGMLGLLGCSVESSSQDSVRPPATADSDSKAAPTPTPPPAATDPTPLPLPVPGDSAIACSGVPASLQLATAVDPQDVQLVDGRVYYRDGNSLSQVNLDATGARIVAFGSPTFGVTRYFVDRTAVVEVSGTTAGGWQGSFRFLSVGGLENGSRIDFGGGSGSGGGTASGATPTTGLRVLGSRDGSYYVTDGTPQGTRLQRWTIGTSATTGGPTLQLSHLAEDVSGLTDPVLTSGAVVWVSGGRSVMSYIFGGWLSNGFSLTFDPRFLGAVDGCRLAVGATHSLCSTNGALIALSPMENGQPLLQTVLAVGASKVSSPFGAIVADGDTAFVASAQPSADAFKNVLRAVLTTTIPATERLLACGREEITSVAFDATHVVFAEKGRGVFVVAR